ncbi:MAG: dual specificity protein phosphatase family protein [archaeon]|nr:MAG: dual specificity protein phosphatase family protein [archaeon]
MGTGGLFLRRLRAKVSEEPTGFVWIEKGRLAASGYPASRSQIEWLRKKGVGVILTLTEKPLPDELKEGFGISFEHVPMKDHEPPSEESLEQAAKSIESGLGSGKMILVHCLAGQGRTGCALAAYLVDAGKVGADEAIRELRKIKPEFIEGSQEEAVRRFCP